MAPLISISALTSACSGANENKFCNAIEMSPVTNWRGEVVAYQGRDRNGLPVRVDPSNSDDWICLTGEEIREREAQRVKKLEKECAKYNDARPSLDAILACEELELMREEARSDQGSNEG